MVNPNTKSATLEENQFQMFHRYIFSICNSKTLSIFRKKPFDFHRTLPKLHSAQLLQFTIRGPTIHHLTMHETVKRRHFKT